MRSPDDHGGNLLVLSKKGPSSRNWHLSRRMFVYGYWEEKRRKRFI